ncbi:MAG TPA: hypothetical protein VFV38_50855 [Ktedonobacteraceae bacterium]|nr:hypothetical protein [Ktedonobacteraceae bacterium]
MIDIDTLQETHTWQYLLWVNPVSVDGRCYAQALFQLCPAFTQGFCLELTSFDREDRQYIKQVLHDYGLSYTVEPFLRPCADE